MKTFDEYLVEKIRDAMQKIFGKDGNDGMFSSASDTGHKSIKYLDDKRKSNKQDFKNHRLEKFIKKIETQLKKEKEDTGSEKVFSQVDLDELLRFIGKYDDELKMMKRERAKKRDERMLMKQTSTAKKEHKKWLKKTLDEIRDHREDSIGQLEDDFFAGEINRGYLINFLSAFYEDERLKYFRPMPDQLVFIDEGQDYGVPEYKFLKLVEPNCIFNIFGDTGQKIYDRGVASWDELKKIFGSEYFVLDKDYRNSNQIVEYVNQRLGKQIQPIGFDTKEVETIDFGKLPTYLTYERKLLRHRVAIVTDEPAKYEGVPTDVDVMSVKEIKGLEFDAVFVSEEILEQSENYQYVALTRALSDMYVVVKK